MKARLESLLHMLNACQAASILTGTMKVKLESLLGMVTLWWSFNSLII
jgi:hypothetical protein